MQLKALWVYLFVSVNISLLAKVSAASNVYRYTLTAKDKPERSADAIGNMLIQAVSLMGIPYRWGGNTPDAGMDCSGFIRYVFKKSFGITLPRTAAEMAKVGKRISLRELEPGDLLFFNNGWRINHVGMFIGNGKFIQSPRTGEKIQISLLNSYWKSRISGAKRIVQENQTKDGNTTLETYQGIKNQILLAGHKHRRKAANRHRRKKVKNR